MNDTPQEFTNKIMGQLHDMTAPQPINKETVMTKCEEMFYKKSNEVKIIMDKLYDLTLQIQYNLSDLETLKYELGSYDADLDEPDLNGKEEFDLAVEHGDTDRTLP